MDTMTAERRGPRTALAFCLIALAVLSACSVNGVGVVSQNRTDADGAWVLSRTAPGIHLELTAANAALVIGHFNAQYVFPAGCGATHPPQLALRRAYGFQLAASGSGVDATLGYRETAILVSTERDSHYARSIAFDPSRPEHTILRFQSPSGC